jgi:hypothetical protein
VSIRRRFHIQCDRCDETYDWAFDPRFDTVAEAESLVREEGWRVRSRSRCHVCPECVAQEGEAQ